MCASGRKEVKGARGWRAASWQLLVLPAPPTPERFGVGWLGSDTVRVDCRRRWKAAGVGALGVGVGVPEGRAAAAGGAR